MEWDFEKKIGISIVTCLSNNHSREMTLVFFMKTVLILDKVSMSKKLLNTTHGVNRRFCHNNFPLILFYFSYNFL